MNSRAILGISIAAVFAVMMIATPLASAVANIVSATGETGGDELEAEIKTASKISKNGNDGAFGYGVVTLNNLGGTGDSLMVATTHAGVLDSEVQNGNPNSPKWHTHYVQLKGAGTYCTDTNGAAGLPRLEVDNLSFQAPGEWDVEKRSLEFDDMPGTFSGNDALTGSSMTWQPNTDAQLVVQFTLNPVTTGIPPNAVFHVCVENVIPVALDADDDDDDDE